MARVPSVRPSDPHADVAGALHDVSNSLTVILGWAAEARSAGASPEALLHSLEVIEDQARFARQLARRAIGAEGPVEEEETQLDALLGPTMDALAVEAQRAGVRLTLVGRAAGARVQRGTDLRQVLTNLVLNGLAFAPKGSTLSLELAVGATSLTIDVEDEGRGVPEDRRASIFDGHSERDGGAGIGLRHARALARAASGDLELAESAASGASTRGARFRITWPRWGTVSIPPPSASSVPVLLGRRVLVVEDDEHVALLLETALGARGATVKLARNAADFDLAIGSGEQDIALVDLSPLAADLHGSLTRLRERSPKVALVIISGSATGLPDELVLHDVRWVRKPFEVAEVVSAVLASRPT